MASEVVTLATRIAHEPSFVRKRRRIGKLLPVLQRHSSRGTSHKRPCIRRQCAWPSLPVATLSNCVSSSALSATSPPKIDEPRSAHTASLRTGKLLACWRQPGRAGRFGAIVMGTAGCDFFPGLRLDAEEHFIDFPLRHFGVNEGRRVQLVALVLLSGTLLVMGFVTPRAHQAGQYGGTMRAGGERTWRRSRSRSPDTR